MLQIDPWLEPFQNALKRRFSKAKEWMKTIDETEGGLDKFSKARVPRLFGPPVPANTLQSRASTFSVSMLTRTTTLSTGSGHQMLNRHSSLVTSVSPAVLFLLNKHANLVRWMES